MTTLFDTTEATGAIISECGLYRYRLHRTWDPALPSLVVAMQNPSTATAEVNDPTITRVIGFARRHGFGGIIVVNAFAMRATDERELLKHPDPVGPMNRLHLKNAVQEASAPGSRLIVAWGKQYGGKLLRTAYQEAIRILAPAKPYCLGTNLDGTPKHPLFLAASTEMVPWGWSE